MSNCDQFREMYEAYALGALDPPERAALEAHLASGCPQCTKVVAEARWLVSQLAYTAADAHPSDMLKGRLMQTVRAEARSAKLEGGAAGGRGTPFWMSAGIAALLLVTIYSAWNAHHIQEELRSNERTMATMEQGNSENQRKLAAIEQQMAEMRRENAILTDSTAVKITLMPQKIQAPQLVAMWQEKDGIVVTGQKVPMPAENRVLQLWLIPKAPGAKPMPSVTLRPDANGKLVMVVAHPPENVHDFKALAITEEPEGGSPQPTSAIRWVGAMT